MPTVILTTKDNPYDFFTQEDEWRKFDHLKGYNSEDYLARIAHVSDSLSDKEYNDEIKRAIEEIITLDPFDIYCMKEKKVDD
jgi:hypothetical protein